jgi:hypothetical protein
MDSLPPFRSLGTCISADSSGPQHAGRDPTCLVRHLLPDAAASLRPPWTAWRSPTVVAVVLIPSFVTFLKTPVQT